VILPEEESQSTAVYGLYKGRAIYGPVDWDQFYGTWDRVEDIYKESRNKNEPLLKQHMTFLKKLGFEFIKRLGKGGYGQVWKVKASKLKIIRVNGVNRFVPIQVACKIVSLKSWSHLSHLREAVEELMVESETHLQLRHKNVVQIKHHINIFDKKSGFPKPIYVCLFMELCDGSLDQIIDNHKNKRLPESKTHKWFVQIIEGLRYLHDLNVVHMDIKPENILWKWSASGNRVYKLTDFGLSLKFRAGEPTTYDTRVGTYPYRAPEMNRIFRLSNMNTYETKPTDIYSLGIVLAESLAGYQFYKYIVSAAQNWTPDTYRIFKISQPLAQLLTAMTRFNPNERPTIHEIFEYNWIKSPFKSVWLVTDMSEG
jgi:serine/threonine protein kinase